MSNVIELSAFKGARPPKRVLHSGNDELVEPHVKVRRRSGRSMHTFVFRSYDLIVEAAEADLMRDVCFDMHKAQVKLTAIRRQIAADREHAAAREKLLTSAEAKLSAAIDAARSVTPTPAPSVEVKPPRRTLAYRREFDAAMRQRIRDVAASRDLSEEQIKPALTLKHQEIAKFTEKHGVNLEWLLEGTGRIFTKDPIAPTPNLTGEEFVALVRTMPIKDQEIILTMLRQMGKRAP